MVIGIYLLDAIIIHILVVQRAHKYVCVCVYVHKFGYFINWTPIDVDHRQYVMHYVDKLRAR